MTAPRIPLFQRKGAPSDAGAKKPSITIAIGHGDPHAPGSSQENADQPDDGGPQPVQCPNCGCTFDPDTGEVVDTGDSGTTDMNGAAAMHPMPPGMMPDSGGDNS